MPSSYFMASCKVNSNRIDVVWTLLCILSPPPSLSSLWSLCLLFFPAPSLLRLIPTMVSVGKRRYAHETCFCCFVRIRLEGNRHRFAECVWCPLRARVVEILSAEWRMWVLITNFDCRETIEWNPELENEFFIVEEGYDPHSEENDDSSPQHHNITPKGKTRHSGNVVFRIVMKGNAGLPEGLHHNGHNNHHMQERKHNSKRKGKEDSSGLPLVSATIIAVSSDWENIEAHWRWIDENILFFFGFFDRTAPNEERELW